MSAATDAPVALIPGPHGLDSPPVTADLPRFRRYAWIDLAEHRAAGRPSTLPTIEWALGHAADPQWPLWWLQQLTHGWLVHVAQVTTIEGGGQMLLSACLRSQPWIEAPPDVVLRANADPAEHWTRCQVCARA